MGEGMNVCEMTGCKDEGVHFHTPPKLWRQTGAGEWELLDDEAADALFAVVERGIIGPGAEGK